MLSFKFNSLSFTPVMPMKKEFFISVVTGDGQTQQTPPIHYDPNTNFSKINHKLEFHVNDPKANMCFEIKLRYVNMITQKIESLCSETIHVNKMLATDILALPTKCGLSCKLSMFLEVSDEFMEFIPKEAIVREKPREQSIEDIFNSEGFSVQKMKYLYKAMVDGLTPIVQAKEAIEDFLNWKDPSQTFFFSIILTLFILQPRYSIVAGFVILFFFDKSILFTLINKANSNTQKQSSMMIHKKNMKFVKQLLTSHSIAYDYYSRLFKDSDKTLLIKSFFQIKYYAPYIVPVLFLIKLRYILLLGYWGYILNNTRLGNSIFLTVQYRINRLIQKYQRRNCHLANTVSETSQSATQSVKNSIKTLFSKDSKNFSLNSSAKSPASSVSTQASLHFSFSDVSGSPPKRTVSMTEKTFVVYENQRWWLGQGWRSELLPGERPSWSDETGKVELDMENMQLPSENWTWENDWSFVVSQKTDLDGWEYASKFKRFEDPDRKPSIVNFVRRRKWVRKCIGFDDNASLSSL